MKTKIMVVFVMVITNETLNPIILKKMNIDPVVSTNPLIFAAIDIMALIFYFFFCIICNKKITMSKTWIR